MLIIIRLYLDVRKEPLEAQRLRRDRAAWVVSLRISRMAARHRAEVVVIAAQILPRQNVLRRSRMPRQRTGRSTAIAQTNACNGEILTRLYLDVRQEPPEAQRLRRDRAAPAVTLRATRMSRERICPIAHTVKGLALRRDYVQNFLWQSQSEQSSITRMADRHRAEVIVTAAQNSATAK